jgi:MoaA/NifB/PqqE/SkfB family radical SAM enzyme/SAM-dependent methyltransferase
MDFSGIKSLIGPFRRIVENGKVVYINTKDAGWFIPNFKGDEVLQAIAGGGLALPDPDTALFLAQIQGFRPGSYSGREATIKPEVIRELWFHVTNRCNLACTHCLFSSSPEDDRQLAADTVLSLAAEAYQKGCRLFAITGGEPFVHPEIETIITSLLAMEGSHVAVLTNGLSAASFVEKHSPNPDFFHLQISVDGMKENHERIRSKGSFRKLTENLKKLKKQGFPFTLSMCVTSGNVSDMENFVDFAAEYGASNVHYMWYFVKGRGVDLMKPDLDAVFEHLLLAVEKAENLGITIDNIEALKTQVFAPAGTVHDGSSAGWESLAVGPDGLLYPSAALVGNRELSSDLSPGLVETWLNSPVLKTIRSSSVIRDDTSDFRHILGGGDLDHSYIGNGTFMGNDPYTTFFEKLVLRLIIREAESLKILADRPGMVLQMGDILESCGAHGGTAFVHSNCLLATSQNQSLTTVKTFYSQAAGDKNTGILNPVCYDPSLLSHIPEEFRFRGYGCGSPVLDAGIEPGEDVVDLGCGNGVECFIAAGLCGREGTVTGVDMLDPMLSLAEKGRGSVEKNLGYRNISFKKGYLENLPIPDGFADIVLSNCVMNLSVNKRKAYSEIFRILRPGGKLVISDVVCETEPRPAIRNDETLKGECIAGALTETRLLSMLIMAGFTGTTLIKRFPYRTVGGHDFFSLTFKAVKPEKTGTVRAMYRGPLPYLTAHDGTHLQCGSAVALNADEAERLGDQVFILDRHGSVTNIDAENGCACHRPPDKPEIDKKEIIPSKHRSGCMACGSPLIYEPTEIEAACHYCGSSAMANCFCEKGHFVCNRCHTEDGLSVIESMCLSSKKTDMLDLFRQIRKHPSIPVHGPDYHAMIPGIILSTYRNSGGPVTDDAILSGISRGATVAGGYCGFMGICGAAVGVGVAFSVILEASPVKKEERQIVQSVTCDVLKTIAGYKAARCCQRDGYLALKKAAELSKAHLTVELTADHDLRCLQAANNKECLGKGCPLFRNRSRNEIFSQVFTMATG